VAGEEGAGRMKQSGRAAVRASERITSSPTIVVWLGEVVGERDEGDERK